MNDPLDELDRREKELEAQLASLREERHRIVCEAAGVKEGSIIEKDGRRYRVAMLKTHGRSGPTVYGNPQRKDGSYGTDRRYLGGDGWRVVEA
ncbi:hypothetical protein [Propylenella binzhouense]|uniref:Uncharacterized protein n=1 Tax=Propylenella binzhouense TaxID=2555902 RepID=A0A964WSY3_9HYPH|nr:hypothetical protein [Propylenella binzhouense]MYZ47452.1 hypothetical protein [Propylenella binzhouense]